jgi:hypothetical protein
VVTSNVNFSAAKRAVTILTGVAGGGLDGIDGAGVSTTVEPATKSAGGAAAAGRGGGGETVRGDGIAGLGGAAAGAAAGATTGTIGEGGAAWTRVERGRASSRADRGTRGC